MSSFEQLVCETLESQLMECSKMNEECAKHVNEGVGGN